VPVIVKIFLFLTQIFIIFLSSLIGQNKSLEWEIVRDDSIVTVRKIGDNKIDTVLISTNEDKSNYLNDEDYSDYYYFIDSYYNLSLIGPYLSYEYSYEGSGGAHPIYGSFYRTLNLLNKLEVSLDELFDKEILLSVLLNDSLIQAHLVNDNPKTLNELEESLIGGCEISFYEFLKSFSIKAIHQNKVEIEFGLTHGCEALRGNFTSFTIILPISNKLKKYTLK
jgi:hypothetical protein